MHKNFAKVAGAGVMAAAMLASSTAAFVPMSTSAGLMVGQVDFEDGIGLPWHTCQTNPANQKFDISGGTYNVELVNIGGSVNGGESRWDLQLRHRGLKIKAGETYKVSFDVNSSSDGRMYTKIGDLSGDLEIWHNNMGATEAPSTTQSGSNIGFNQSWDPIYIAKGDNHLEATFTADQDLDVAEWAFHYGGRGQHQESFDCFPKGTVLKFDNLSLECTSSTACDWDTTNEMGYVTPRSDVRLNQVGYFTNLKKVASYATDEKISPVSFKVVDKSGNTVYTGTGEQFAGRGTNGADYGSGEYIQLLDFTDVPAGTGYHIEVDDTSNTSTNRYTKETYKMYISHDFDVVDPGTDNVYDGVLKNALNYYYQNRSGVEIQAAYITSAGDGQTPADLAHQAGHVKDMAYIQSKWVKAYASDGSDVEKSNGQLDCTGGWYDAGDHGKYVVNGGISVWTLQNMYELSKASGTDSKWTGNAMSIPESGDSNPDILDETKVELDFMFKMIVDSGTNKGLVYHKMHDHKWTGLAVEPWNYAEDHVDASGNKVKGWGTIRIVKPPTYAATFNMIACAAQAARLWKGIDDTYAATCLQHAEDSYEAIMAMKSKWNIAEGNSDKDPLFAPLDQAIGGGAYGDTYVGDDAYWAACELYATTGDSKYYNDLKEYKNPNDSTGNDKAFSITTNLGGGENAGSFSSFNWGCTAGCGTLTLYLNKDNAALTDLTAANKTAIEDSIVAAADAYLDQQSKEGMAIPYKEASFQDAVNIGEGITITGYEWGSNSFVINNAIVMAYGYKIKGDNSYISGVGAALDYIFGRNGQGISYVTGTGDYYTKNPHHRFWSYELDHNFPKAPDGVLSGGPGSGLQDPYVGGLGYKRGEVAPQKCYVDSIEAWSVNEVTINWNAPFAWVISFLDDEIADAPDVDDEPKTQGSSSTSGDTDMLWGDANDDKVVNMGDVVAIMRNQADPDSYKLEGIGKLQADVFNNGDGPTNNDALSIQRWEAGLITDLDPASGQADSFGK
ncbi:MAG: glycoside hydrolase family 9 protein [Ruminococcus sp.]|nr:glycoside hydrolase family 9 protein [Ruminococcus sp.]